QSSPGFGAGRYLRIRRLLAVLVVVSILARLWGRALRQDHPLSSRLAAFQSSPGFGAGRYVDDPLEAASVNGSFNPRPALGPGATQHFHAAHIRQRVSILARLWGRALR